MITKSQHSTNLIGKVIINNERGKGVIVRDHVHYRHNRRQVKVDYKDGKSWGNYFGKGLERFFIESKIIKN